MKRGQAKRRHKKKTAGMAGGLTGLLLSFIVICALLGCGDSGNKETQGAGQAAGQGTGQAVGQGTGQIADGYLQDGTGTEGSGQEDLKAVVSGQGGTGTQSGTAQGGAGIQSGTAQGGAGTPPSGFQQGTLEGTGESWDGMDELEIHFLDVGQGDCTLIRCGGESMLIDAGGNDQGTKIQNYLQKQGVDILKYAICTHPDEDHIGGMDVILYKFDCETVLMTEEEKDTNTYRDVVDTMESRNNKRTLPVVGQQYALGDAVFTIVGPSAVDSDSNNNSIAIVLEHGENKFLFTGDAEEDEEADMLGNGISLDVDVYKAGHHGSRTSSSLELLEAVSPAYAVISCGEGNSYGHPHAETLNNLRAMGVQVFRTDEQGSIVVTSDGSALTWNCSPSETWQAGEPTGSAAGTAPASTPEPVPETAATVSTGTTGSVSYICNTNTMKFHRPDCSSVKQMKEENKLSVDTAREDLINQGYDPCKRCNP